ncbi:MAG: peptide-methionine (R)-S-oxide reductase MsrB [Candidatus Altimarinota bacterium]
MDDSVQKSDDQWQQELTPDQYRVMRMKGTEAPFTGEYVHTKTDGTYKCAGCGADLFDSDTKFDSGTGWPSFSDMKNTENIELKPDTSHGMVRTEVLCKRCGAHLGHVFDDGPSETGKRYCINSCSLKLDERK